MMFVAEQWEIYMCVHQTLRSSEYFFSIKFLFLPWPHKCNVTSVVVVTLAHRPHTRLTAVRTAFISIKLQLMLGGFVNGCPSATTVSAK